MEPIWSVGLLHMIFFFCPCSAWDLTDFPGGSAVRNLPASSRHTGPIPGLGGSLGEGNGNPLKYSCLENATDRGARQPTLQGVSKELDTSWQPTTTCGILVLPPGIKPTPQHWKLGVLTTGGQGSPSTLISERTMAPSKWLSYPQRSAVRTENWCLGLTQASLASFSGLSLGPL